MRSVVDQCLLTASPKCQTAPGLAQSVNLIIQMDRLKPLYRAGCDWVGCLQPLIAPSQFREDNLEVKLSVFSSEVFQLVQSGEQQS